MLKETVKALAALDGISGRETPVSDYIISQIKGIAEYGVDALGNVIVFKRGKERAANKVLLDAHMDEVGLIITFIADNGMLRFAKVGGVDTKVLLGRTVTVGEDKIPGVIGIKPIHLTDRDKELDVPEEDSLYIDIGAASKAEAEAVVAPGDYAVFDSDFTEFGNGFVKGRALDDRVGCAVLLEMIKSELPYDMWFSFTVQEEVGLRGAAAAAFTVAPDYAIVTETTTASDIAGVEGDKEVCRLGKGAVISFMDRSTVYNRDLYDKANAVAAEKGIAVQTKSRVAGGNNAGAIHKSGKGVKVLTVSVPTRYLHSPGCVMQWSDVEATEAVVRAMAEELAHG